MSRTPRPGQQQAQFQLRQLRVEKYGARYWAVYSNGELLAVTVYKKGAKAICEALTNQQQNKVVYLAEATE